MAKQGHARNPSPRRSVKSRPAPRRGRARRRRPTILLVLALIALIAGFLFRRTMLPQAVHYLAYRPPDRPGASAGDRANNNAEDLTDSDRQELGAVVRQKSK